MTDVLKVGVIGTGFVGGAHIEAIRRTALAEVVAVTASNPASARQAADRHLIPTAYDSWQELVADPTIDVVHNCTPNYLHAEIAGSVLCASKHLVTEKPLTTNSEDAARLVSLRDRAGVVAAVCHNYRHYAMTAQTRALIASGAIGKVHHAHGSYLQDWLCEPGVTGWRLEPDQGGPSIAFADIGTHWCDLVSHLLNERITALNASSGGLAGRGRDDHLGILLRFESGALGTVTISQVSPGRKNRLFFQIDGSEASIAWDQERPDELWVGRPGLNSDDVRKSGRALEPPAQRLAHFPPGHTEGWNTSFKNLFLSVYRTIRGDAGIGDDAFATLSDGSDCVRLIEAVAESNSSGAWSRLDNSTFGTVT